MKSKQSLLYLILIAFLFGACASRKRMSTVQSPIASLSPAEMMRNEVSTKLFANNFQYGFLSMKAKVHSVSKKQDLNITLNIRMQQNEKIWVSVNALGGFEVARVLLNKDSIAIIDRMNKVYEVHDYKYLSTLLKTDVDFYGIQALLLGNCPNTFNFSEGSLRENELNYYLQSSTEWQTVEVGLLKSSYRMNYLQMESLTGMEKKSLLAAYDNFKLLGIQSFAHAIAINVNTASDNLKIEVQYTKVEQPEKLDFPFNVPKRFE
jgi:hypothetical protein